MNCPLCNAPLRFNYRKINDGHLKGYTDTLSCTKCDAVIDLQVNVSNILHNVVNGIRDDGNEI